MVESSRPPIGAYWDLVPHRRPHANQVFDALDAEEVRESIERLRKVLPDLIGSTHAWLRRHGVELE